MNRLSLTTLVHKTPYEALDGKNTSLAHLKLFGCDSFVHVPKEKRSKLDTKYEKCMFIGYKDAMKWYKLWNLVIMKEVYSRDVIFKEVGGTSKSEEVRREKEPKK